MLMTVTLASQHLSFVGVWIGSSLGMVVADGPYTGWRLRFPARSVNGVQFQGQTPWPDLAARELNQLTRQLERATPRDGGAVD